MFLHHSNDATLQSAIQNAIIIKISIAFRLANKSRFAYCLELSYWLLRGK